MMRVRATREGLQGKPTASGFVICDQVAFVALPTRLALHRHVRLRNPANGASCIAEVLDVGPWNIADDDYVLRGSRPQAEGGTDRFGRKTNGAGIDLGEKVWKALRMTDNAEIEWEFVSPTVSTA